MQTIGNLKQCGKCKETLPTTDFHKASRERDGLQQWCKVCRKGWKHEERKAYHKDRYHNKKDQHMDWSYQRKYGISLDRYNEMLSSQGGVCAICKKECSSGKRLCVDHNHTTGEVRGLLCGNCNKGIGNLQDSIELLEKTIQYLKEHNK